MKIKISELEGQALDWVVAKCEICEILEEKTEMPLDVLVKELPCRYTPSTNWEQGGPIIDREEINLTTIHDKAGKWGAFYDDGFFHESLRTGPTPLIAAMRCFVSMKMGDEADEVEISDEFSAIHQRQAMKG